MKNKKNTSNFSDQKEILERNFKLYLLHSKNLTERTVKNYLVDFRHFIDWLKNSQGNLSQVEELGQIHQKITSKTLKKYQTYLSATDLAKSTVKRRLSTLRIFCQFLLDQNLIKTDPSFGLENPSETGPKQEKINQLTTKFERYLKSQDASQNTVKNYLADVKNYLEWAVNAES
jgi:integrase/recombinase XerD